MGHKVLCGLGNWVKPVQDLLQRLDRPRYVCRAQVDLIIRVHDVREELQSAAGRVKCYGQYELTCRVQRGGPYVPVNV